MRRLIEGKIDPRVLANLDTEEKYMEFFKVVEYNIRLHRLMYNEKIGFYYMNSVCWKDNFAEMKYEILIEIEVLEDKSEEKYKGEQIDTIDMNNIQDREEYYLSPSGSLLNLLPTKLAEKELGQEIDTLNNI